MRIKKFICLILSFIILTTCATPALAANDYKYGTLSVTKLKDSRVTKLNVMVSGNNLYVDAREIASYMGYDYQRKGNTVVLGNTDIYRVMVYNDNDATIKYLYLSSMVEYEAPAKSIADGDYFWIPLHITLKMMDSDICVTPYGTSYNIIIDTPDDSIASIYCELLDSDLFMNAINSMGLGITEDLYRSTHAANVLMGMSKLDISCYGQFFSHAFFWVPNTNTTHITDNKCGEELALLFCTNSHGELTEIGDLIGDAADLFSNKGLINDFITNTQKLNDNAAGNIYNELTELMKGMDNTNIDIGKANELCNNLDDMLKKQGIFSSITEPIESIQNSLSEPFSGLEYLDYFLLVLDIVSYASDLGRMDQTSTQILENFYNTCGSDTASSAATLDGLRDVVEASRSGRGVALYSLKETFCNNMDDILSATTLDQYLFGPAGTLVLFAWDLVTSYVPYFSNSIESAELLELCVYASLLQADAFEQFYLLTEKIPIDGLTTSEKEREFISSAYAYLKFSHITRESFVGSFKHSLQANASSFSQEQRNIIEKILSDIESTNEQIKPLLAKLLYAYNNKYAFGFSRAHYDEFMEKQDDSFVIKYVNFAAGNNASAGNQNEPNTTEAISSMVNDDIYRDIVLILDTSGSMYGEPIEETVDAASKFVQQTIGGNTEVGLVTFNSWAEVNVDFTNNTSSLIDSIADAPDEVLQDRRTNTYDALLKADQLLQQSNAEKKIIVLMSDGLPNESPNLVSFWEPYSSYKNELINYSDELKEKGYYIYTLGFFQNLDYSDLSEARSLLDAIASEGYYYDVDDAESISFFFNDIASAISGTNSILIKIACPVDVTVTYAGETLSSNEDSRNTRTSFGSLSFMGYEDEQKILRLQEGRDYDISIIGTGEGTMNYTISFPDENGDYSDVRTFENIPITPNTVINTNTQRARKTLLKVDTDGNGRIDLKYKASENSFGELAPDYSWVYVTLSAVIIISIAVLLLLKFVGVDKIRKAFCTKAQNQQSVADSYCTYCGAKLLPDGAFCPECGKQNIDINSSVYVPEKKYCEYCGKLASTNDPFCENCGHRL